MFMWPGLCVCVVQCGVSTASHWEKKHKEMRRKRSIKDKVWKEEGGQLWTFLTFLGSRTFFRGNAESSQEPPEQDPAGSLAFSFLARRRAREEEHIKARIQDIVRKGCCCWTWHKQTSTKVWAWERKGHKERERKTSQQWKTLLGVLLHRMLAFPVPRGCWIFVEDQLKRILFYFLYDALFL